MEKHENPAPDEQLPDSQLPSKGDTPTSDTAFTPPKQFSPKLLLALMLLVLALTAAAGYVGFRLGKNNLESGNLLSDNSKGEAKPAVLKEESVMPSPSVAVTDEVLGNETAYYFADQNNDVLLKQTVNLIDKRLDFPNRADRILTNVYSYDQNYEPLEATDTGATSLSWNRILSVPIVIPDNQKQTQVSDRLFSFKKVPTSNSFLFVHEDSRGQIPDPGEEYEPLENHTTLYFYNRDVTPAKLQTILSIGNDQPNQNRFPKIQQFSADGRYVSLELFSCWNCGGHMPKTLLVDLQTLKSKEIGRVIQFKWRENGQYEFKDYVTVECDETQLHGPCAEEPEKLPLKTGGF